MLVGYARIESLRLPTYYVSRMKYDLHMEKVCLVRKHLINVRVHCDTVEILRGLPTIPITKRLKSVVDEFNSIAFFRGGPWISETNLDEHVVEL